MANEVDSLFANGVIWCDLAAITEAVYVPTTLAAHLGLQEQANPSVRATLADHLRQKNMLLVLDQFFGVIEDKRDRAMFTLMLRCGLRISEVAQLQLGDLYLAETLPRLVANGKGPQRAGGVSQPANRRGDQGLPGSARPGQQRPPVLVPPPALECDLLPGAAGNLRPALRGEGNTPPTPA